MTRLLLIASWVLIIGIVAANTAESNAEASASAVAKASSGDQSDDEECDDSDTTPEPSVTTTEGPKLTCKGSEYLDDCPVDCPSDYCPKSEVEAQASFSCPRPKICPPPQCKCGFNSRRAENGTCIPTRSCPPFKCSGENEEFNSCPPFCPSDDCSQASPSGECPPQFGRIGIVLECQPKCRCRKGYWRKNGVCVPYDQCNATTCGVNEVLVKCPADCPSERCPRNEAETLQPQQCFGTPDPCPPPACRCRLNHRRNENGTCVPTRSCPPFECSGFNEAYDPCPPWCPSDSCSQATPDGRCPRRFGRIGVLLICSPKCRCQKGYWRKDGICVPYAECENKPIEIGPTEPEKQCTGLNEEYSLQKPICPPQECNSLVARIDCRNAPPPQPGCACKSGYMRLNSTSPCIPVCQCPQMRYSPDCEGKTGVEPKEGICTGPYEEYTLEKPNCPPQECFSIVARIDCRNAPPPQPGCACQSGYMRINATSPCIPLCQCPEMRSSPDCAGKTGTK